MVTGGLNAQNIQQTSSVIVTTSVVGQPQTAITVTQANCTSTINSVNLGLSFGSFPMPAYTVSWTPLPATVFNQQQTSATALTAGPYTVTVNSSHGCSTTSNFTIFPKPLPAFFSLTPAPGYTVNCYNPTLTINASPGNYNFNWTSQSSAPLTGSVVNLTSANIGTWSVTGFHPISGCALTQSFSVAQNFLVPSSTISSQLINITCSQTVALTLSLSATPSVNITHQIYAPSGGTFAANSYTALYTPGGPGTYTYALYNNLNGCETVKNFTVTSSDIYPTYTITSANNFTLGCGSKSVTSVSIFCTLPTNTPGGAVSYTILPPGTSPLSLLSNQTTYMLNIPGTWTVMVLDNNNQCITSTPISILQNTIAPDISVNVPQQILDCRTNSVQLNGSSTNPNTTFSWAVFGSPNPVLATGITVASNTSAPTSSIVGIYTLTVEDTNNGCISNTVIPIYQNLFPPKATISTSGAPPVLSCAIPTVVLYNQSTTGIPNSTGFPANLPVIAKEWVGPGIFVPVSSSYTAGAIGTYTLIARDLNNGCTSHTTITIADNRMYPSVAPPDSFLLPCPGSVAIYPTIAGPPANYSYSWTPAAGSTVSALNSGTILVTAPGFYTLTVTNTSNGCQTRMTYPVYACVGIKGNSAADHVIRIFPNPTNGLFSIRVADKRSPLNVEVYNAIGQLIKKEILSDEDSLIDIRSEQAGIYFIYIIGADKKILANKLIKN